MREVLRPCLAAVLALVALPAGAGEPAEGPATLQFEYAVAGPGEGPLDHVMMLRSDETFEAKVVRGAPYQAEAVHEFVQALGDGNRILRRSSSTVARDGEGRTRREHSLAAIGPMVAAASERRAVFIHDPVAGVAWVLRPQEKVARKIALRAMVEKATKAEKAAGAKDHVERIVIRQRGEGGAHAFRLSGQRESEQLGTRTIEGVEAAGTRTTITIPAGAIGNEKPLVITTERWYSPELQTVVMSRQSDPRMGETTFRLTQISRGEPERALFEVPADYTVKEGGAGHAIEIRRHIERTRE